MDHKYENLINAIWESEAGSEEEKKAEEYYDGRTEEEQTEDVARAP